MCSLHLHYSINAVGYERWQNVCAGVYANNIKCMYSSALGDTLDCSSSCEVYIMT